MSLTREPGTPLDAKFEVRCSAHQKRRWVEAARHAGHDSLGSWVRETLDQVAHNRLGPPDGDDPRVDTGPPLLATHEWREDEYIPRIPGEGFTLSELHERGAVKEGDIVREVSTGRKIPITREALAALDRADLPSPPEGSALSSAPEPAEAETDPTGSVVPLGALTDSEGRGNQEHLSSAQAAAPPGPETGEPGIAGELPHEQDGPTDHGDDSPEPGSPEPLDPFCTNAGLHWRLPYGEQCHYCKGVAL